MTPETPTPINTFNERGKLHLKVTSALAGSIAEQLIEDLGLAVEELQGWECSDLAQFSFLCKECTAPTPVLDTKAGEEEDYSKSHF